MMKPSKQFFKKNQHALFSVLGFLAALAVFVPLVSLAQVNTATVPGSTFGLGTADLLSTVIRIIQWALGLLGLVAVIMMMYGGFVWLTSAGNADRIKKAKRIIIQAAIGLVIILLAFAIVYFINRWITGDTNPDAPYACTAGEITSPAPGCQRCNGAGDGTFFDSSIPGCAAAGPQYYVRWSIPARDQNNVSLCSLVGAGFDGVTPPWLDQSTVNDANVFIERTGTPGHIAGSFNWPAGGADTNAFELKPSADLERNTPYTVTVTSNVRSATGVAANGYTWNFTTGTESDANPPRVTTWAPQGTDVCLSPSIQVIFNEPMAPSSVNAANITITPGDVKATNVFMTGPNRFTASLDKPLTGNTEYTVRLNADVTTGFRDTCYNSLDCGNNPNACTSDGNEAGTPNDDMVWRFTTKDTTTTDCKPEIESITNTGPYSNQASQAITITGRNFGIIADTVFFSNKFWGSKILAQDTLGQASQCFNTATTPATNGFWPNQQFPTDSVSCVTNWTDNQIQSVIPTGTDSDIGNGATGGNIQIRRDLSNQGTSDANTQFASITSPYIRAIGPTAGGVGQYVTIFGERFTDTPGRVWFRMNDGSTVRDIQADTPPAICGNTWRDDTIVVMVPSGFNANDVTSIQVETLPLAQANGNTRSNLQHFTVTSDPPGPSICNVNPICHDTGGNTARLIGERFGAVRGSSTGQFVVQGASGTYSPTGYPSWSDTQAELTSQASMPNNLYFVYLNVGGKLSNPSPTYKIPCGEVPQVELNASCNPSAGVTPSTNPFPESQNICVNARVQARFNQDMNDGDIASNTNILLHKCNGGKGVDCTTQVPAVSIVLFNSGANNEGFTFTPNAALDRNSWYQMTIKGDVRRQLAPQVRMGSDFVWNFRTKDDATPCQVDAIALSNIDPLPLPARTNVTTSDSNNTITYAATPVTNNCQVLNLPSTNVNWVSTNTAVADCVAGACGNGLTQDIITDGIESSTTIRATLSGKSAQMPLNVILNYCEKNPDCSQCGGSRCDLAARRCVPVITTIDPPAGPVNRFVTINGCYFGNQTGKVLFDTSEANLNICGPQAVWHNDYVVVGVPSGTPAFAPGDQPDVNVQSVWNSGGTTNYLDSYNSPLPEYTIENRCCTAWSGSTCTSSVDLPISGLIPGLCSIQPNAGGENTTVTFKGVQFPDNSAIAGKATFQGLTTRLDGITANWQGSPVNVVGSRVPEGAMSGDAQIEAETLTGNYCPSNPIPFAVTCNTNSQCVSGCCKNVAGINQCRPSAECLPGNAGDQCKIDPLPSGTTLAASCEVGNTSTIQSGYQCLSDTDFAFAKDPPPPPVGQRCQFCCDPDPDNNGNFSDAQTRNGLRCTPIPAGGGTCSSDAAMGTNNDQKRGLYCGCANDNQCGSSSEGCATQNDALKCCRARPSITSTSSSTLQCTNQVVEYQFDQEMDRLTMTEANIRIVNVATNTAIPVNIWTNPQGFKFAPKTPYAPNTSIRVTVTTGVKNRYGIAMAAEQITIFQVTGTADLCKMDRLVLEWFDEATATLARPPSLFTNATSDGAGDFLRSTNPSTNPSDGNQQFWQAYAVDASGVEINSGEVYTYDTSEANGIFRVSHQAAPPFGDCPVSQTFPFGCLLTSESKNGVGFLKVTADGSSSGTGVITGRGEVRAYMCEKPWPAASTLSSGIAHYPGGFPFQESAGPFPLHFSMQYCPSSGNLPTLLIGSFNDGGVTISSPIVRTPSYVRKGQAGDPQTDELVREYTFIPVEGTGASLKRVGGDKIGLRMYENNLNLSPELWFKRAFPSESSNGEALTIDGYAAYKVGRTTYIGFTDTYPESGNACTGPGSVCANGRTVSFVMVLSHSDGAASGTVGVYNQLLQPDNINFTINLTSASEKRDIREDVKRVNDLQNIGLHLSDYKKLNNLYPKLESGSYLPNITTSAWPSWAQNLSTTLRMQLPKDPAQSLDCQAGHEAATCWSDATKSFNLAGPSSLYQYRASATADTAILFARLKYTGVGSWRTFNNPATYANGCTGVTGSNCTNYNFLLCNSTGTQAGCASFEDTATQYQQIAAIDTTAPVVQFSPAPPNPITQKTSIEASATDTGGSGVARVDFYIDGSWRFADSDGVDGYKWNFDPAPFTNGDHMFKVAATDRAGNRAETADLTITLAGAPADQVPPEFSSFTLSSTGGASAQNVNTIPMPGVTSIEADNNGNYWVASWYQNPPALYRCDTTLSNCTTMTRFGTAGDADRNFYQTNGIPPISRGEWYLGKDYTNGDILLTWTNAKSCSGGANDGLACDVNADCGVGICNAVNRKIIRYAANMSPFTNPAGIYTMPNNVNNLNYALINHAGQLVTSLMPCCMSSQTQLAVFAVPGSGGQLAAPTATFTLPTTAGQIPLAIDIDAQNNIYVPLRDANRVQKYTAGLTFINEISMPSPMAVSMGTNGLYVTQYGNQTISRVDANLTTQELLFGEPGVSGSDAAHISNAYDATALGQYVIIADSSNNRLVRAAPGSLSGRIQFLSSVADPSPIPSGMNRVEYYLGSTYIGQSTTAGYQVEFDTRTIANGVYTAYAVAFDNAGNSSTQRSTIVVYNEGSGGIAAFITNPRNSPVSGTVTIQASAYSPFTITNVSVTGISTAAANPDAQFPYAWSWDTTTVADGTSVTVTITATDARGRTATDSITVTVQNQGGCLGCYQSGSCVDSNDQHCGSNGASCVACPTGQVCAGGTCQAQCPPGTCNQSGACISGASNPLSCGTSGGACNICSSLEQCINGVCELLTTNSNTNAPSNTNVPISCYTQQCNATGTYTQTSNALCNWANEPTAAPVQTSTFFNWDGNCSASLSACFSSSIRCAAYGAPPSMNAQCQADGPVQCNSIACTQAIQNLDPQSRAVFQAWYDQRCPCTNNTARCSWDNSRTQTCIGGTWRDDTPAPKEVFIHNSPFPAGSGSSSYGTMQFAYKGQCTAAGTIKSEPVSGVSCIQFLTNQCGDQYTGFPSSFGISQATNGQVACTAKNSGAQKACCAVAGVKIDDPAYAQIPCCAGLVRNPTTKICESNLCGNGVIDTTAGEQCDGTNLAGQSCTTQGFTGGTLSCYPSNYSDPALRCKFNTTLCNNSCSATTCSNGCCASATQCTSPTNKDACGTTGFGTQCKDCDTPMPSCKTNAACTSGQCTYSNLPDGQTDASCSGANVCCGGACGTKHCSADSECPGGQRCDTPGACTGQCVSTSCPTGQCWNSATSACVNYSTNSCDNDQNGQCDVCAAGTQCSTLTSCNASGRCQYTNAGTSQSCSLSPTNDCKNAVCDGSGNCGTNRPQGTFCNYLNQGANTGQCDGGGNCVRNIYTATLTWNANLGAPANLDFYLLAQGVGNLNPTNLSISGAIHSGGAISSGSAVSETITINTPVVGRRYQLLARKVGTGSWSDNNTNVVSVTLRNPFNQVVLTTTTNKVCAEEWWQAFEMTFNGSFGWDIQGPGQRMLRGTDINLAGGAATAPPAYPFAQPNTYCCADDNQCASTYCSSSGTCTILPECQPSATMFAGGVCPPGVSCNNICEIGTTVPICNEITGAGTLNPGQIDHACTTLANACTSYCKSIRNSATPEAQISGTLKLDSDINGCINGSVYGPGPWLGGAQCKTGGPCSYGVDRSFFSVPDSYRCLCNGPQAPDGAGSSCFTQFNGLGSQSSPVGGDSQPVGSPEL